MTSVSVIIPVFNRPGQVLDALESIRLQTAVPSQLIVVDDGSTDDTAKVVQDWMKRACLDFGAHMHQQPNRGPAAARNAGVEAAGPCEVIAFLDSDDLWPVDYLERACHTLKSHHEAVAVSVDRLDIDLGTGRRRLKRMTKATGNITRYLVEQGPIGTPNTAIRRSAFIAVGGYDPYQPVGEDYQLMLRLSLLGPWQHTSGDPVIVRRSLGQSAKYGHQLSRQHADRRYRLALVLDQFITAEGGAEAVPTRSWKRRLGRLWFAAGRQMAGLDRRCEAAQCFERACQLLPLHLRARWHSWCLGNTTDNRSP